MINDTLLSSIKEAILSSGKSLLTAARSSYKTASKEGDANFVTEYDIRTQNTLIKAFGSILPEASYLAEEENLSENDILEKGYLFVIDPIDGTTNFMYDFNHYAISVCLMRDRSPYLAFIYDPTADELFFAESGKGAFLQKGFEIRPIRVKNLPLSDSLALIGTDPYEKTVTKDITVRAFEALLMNCRDVRRPGAASLDFAYLAAGRANIFFENRLSPWDFAAGRLVLSEAGGISSSLYGNPLGFEKSSVVAGAPDAYRTFMEKLAPFIIG